MFGKLPEIFGRDFVIGYFLPSAVFVAISIGLMSRLGIALPPALGNDIFKDALIFGLVSWFGGTILLAVNRLLIRALEGYGRYNPAKLFKRLEARRFANLNADIHELNLYRDTCNAKGEEIPSEMQDRRIKLSRKAAERFPDQAAWLLPTSFGNTIRAFEVYPRVIYGFDSIYGWDRLLAVIPKEYRELVETAKSQMDFWVNLLFLSVLVLLEYTYVIYVMKLVMSWWVAVAALGVMAISYTMARNAAVVWGDLVKAAFDVYLPELRKKLEFAFPVNKNKERELWTRYSQTIIYRIQETMPEREQPKEKS